MFTGCDFGSFNRRGAEASRRLGALDLRMSGVQGGERLDHTTGVSSDHIMVIMVIMVIIIMVNME